MADSNISPDRQDFAVHSLEIAAILRHLGFPLKKIALRSKDGMAAFIFPVSVQLEVEMIRARIEQLLQDVRRVKLEEAQEVAGAKARRAEQVRERQHQDAMANFIKIGEMLEGKQR